MTPFSLDIPHIGKMTRQCRGNSHLRANKMRASTTTLTAFEIAV
jgi:hypothetical protein